MRRTLTSSALVFALAMGLLACTTSAQKKDKPDPLKEAVRKYEQRLMELDAALRRSKGKGKQPAKAEKPPAKTAQGKTPPQGKGKTSGKPTRATNAAFTQMQADLETARNHTLTLERNLQSSLRSNRDLTKQLAASKRLQATTRKEKETFAKQANRLEVQLIQLRRAAAASEKTNQSERTALNRKLEQAQRGATDLAKQLASQRNEMALLRKQLEVQSVELKKSQIAAASAQSAYDKSRAALQSVEQHMGDVSKELLAVRREAKDQADAFGKARASLAASKRREKDLLALAQQSELTVKAANDRLGTMRKKLAQAQARADDNDKQSRSLQAALAATKQAHAKLKKEHITLASTAKDVESNAANLLKKTATLQTTNADYTKQLTVARQAMATAKERVADLMAQNRQLVADRRAAHQNAQQKSTELTDLRKQIAALTQQQDQLRRENANLRKVRSARAAAPQAVPTTSVSTTGAPDEGIRIYNQGGTVIIHRNPPQAGANTPRRSAPRGRDATPRNTNARGRNPRGRNTGRRSTGQNQPKAKLPRRATDARPRRGKSKTETSEAATAPKRINF